MSDLRIDGVTSASVPAPRVGVRAGGAGGGFGEALRGALDQVNQLQHTADETVRQYALGQNRDIAGTLLTVEKANLAFQFTLQLRAKLLDAYQEIMRMPI